MSRTGYFNSLSLPGLNRDNRRTKQNILGEGGTTAPGQAEAQHPERPEQAEAAASPRAVVATARPGQQGALGTLEMALAVHKELAAPGWPGALPLVVRTEQHARSPQAFLIIGPCMIA
ncbi:uncharacterized protein LOC105014559 [Esox lucius]|uniref:uncharacterized protein LOC105014559 n=1 Tax=Esox lucius TaxID=8010 RepID=UPI0014770D6C|nr:uncharacterized protein LOC105014559 [Esox lucius]